MNPHLQVHIKLQDWKQQQLQGNVNAKAIECLVLKRRAVHLFVCQTSLHDFLVDTAVYFTMLQQLFTASLGKQRVSFAARNSGSLKLLISVNQQLLLLNIVFTFHT